jgi:hypothetical protein
MPSSIYRNDGTGRDSYVNSASMTETQRKALRGVADNFWPNTTLLKQRAHLDGTLMSLTSTGNGGLGSLSGLSSPTSTVRMPQIPVSPGKQASSFLPSPRKRGVAEDAFSQRGQISPRTPRVVLPSPRIYETEAGHAGRTGRYSVPSYAPETSPRLPGLKLHKTVGVLDEV